MSPKAQTQKTGQRTANADTWKCFFVRLPWLMLVPLGFALPLFAANNSAFINGFYAEKLYPFIAKTTQLFTSFLPFSLAEFILVSGSISLAAFVVVLAVRLIMRKTSVPRFFNTILTIVIIAGAMLNMFYVMWGFNYNRADLSHSMNLEVTPRSTEELQQVCYYLVAQANAYRENVPTNSDGVFESELTFHELQKVIEPTYAALAEQYPIFAGSVGNVKGVVLSKGLSYAGISGIFIPFTNEANVNIDQPSLLLLASAAHESAHQLGIAKEDEANFASYLVGTKSNSADLCYSATMLALINCTNKLYEADSDAYFEVYSLYGDGIKRDLADYNKYWKQFEGPVEETFENLNDSYLQFNNHESGVNSYGEMVDLVIAYYFDVIIATDS